MRHRVAMITRLRLDAALYEPAASRKEGQLGRPRKKGARLPSLLERLEEKKTQWMSVMVANWYGQGPRQIELCTGTGVWYHSGLPVVPIRWVLLRDPLGKFEPQALLCTELAVPAAQILRWFVMRWKLEVTFEEAHAHLGVETLRQWSDKAIARATPALFGLYSLVTLMAHRLIAGGSPPVRTAACYAKELPTFSDAIALVRRSTWGLRDFSTSGEGGEMLKVPRQLVERLAEAACYAA